MAGPIYTLLNGLNAAQKAAVTSEADVLQVLAPPGSGKTKTLTSRVAYLLQHWQYKPWNIICLTFTIKSSREMRERISNLLGNGIESRLILGTFHSVCRRYLVTYGHLIGIRKEFGIADTSDTIGIIKRIIKRHKVNIDAKQAQARISHNKSKGISHVDLAHEHAKKKKVEQQEFVTIYEEYEKQLAISNLLDYDDLLLRCADLLRSHPSCVSNVEAVLIDEFQDTNVVQFELMTLFALARNRVTTVGDPDQSIYGWRSAESKNLKKMRRQYTDTLVIHLEDNYRSSGAILLAAGEVIEQDESRPQKPLMPTHCPGTRPVLRLLPSAEVEAAWITSEIQRTRALTGGLLQCSDFAILLRSAALSRLVESKLGKAGIPYRMIGGHRFYDRVEIKILLDYLRVISQPDNNDAVARIINTPARGLGETTIKTLLDEAEAKRITLWQLARNILQGYTRSHLKISNAGENGLGKFTGIIISCRNRLLDTVKAASPDELLMHLVQKLDFKAHLEKSHAEDHEARWANVEELMAQAADHHPVDPGESVIKENSSHEMDDSLPVIAGVEQAESRAAEEALSRLLANVALATDLRHNDENEDGKPQSQVTITTIHSAKGLEWPVVFVPSAYNGCIPHSRAEDTDEERRLLYVAMTRAQALLYMSCPTKNSQHEEATLSPFLAENKVKRLMSNKGPVIGASVVVDIARILRRDCPFQEDIDTASKALESYEDNQWPLDGTEDPIAKEAKWNKWDRSARDDERPTSKRRRTATDRKTGTIPMYTALEVGVTTTMQIASAFSCSGSGGFTTAAIQMQMGEPQVPDTSKEDDSNRHKTNRKRLGDACSDQGNLLSLWGMESAKADVHTPRTSVPTDKLRPIVAVRKASVSQPRVSATCFTDGVRASGTRLPLASIPQSLASHQLPMGKGSGRPRPLVSNRSASSEHLFLSSSPPPEDAAPKNESTLEDEASDARAVEPAPCIIDFKPADTFHVTSVARTQMNIPRKTLGVRRSMAGWNAGSRQGFCVPTIRRPNG